MFSLPSLFRSRSSRKAYESYRPSIDTLEERVCPTDPNVSVPGFLTMSAMVHQDEVVITGHVTASNGGAGYAICITGGVGGWTSTDNNGNFSYTKEHATLGDVYAYGTNAMLMDTTNTATTTLTSDRPIIQDFVAIHEFGSTWTFRGRVLDENAEGLTVTFTGHMFNQPGTTTVNADGTFSVTFFLPEGSRGDVTAMTTDWWGQDSDPAYVNLV